MDETEEGYFKPGNQSEAQNLESSVFSWDGGMIQPTR